MQALIGVDGRARCPWAVGDDYIAYHDTEWGRPVRGDAAIFERLTLEAFQSGLSWITILRKREGFRQAFDGFDIDRVADYTDADRARLMGDAGIVRNRRKIDAAISNARAVQQLRDRHGDGALDALVWSFAPSPMPPRTGEVRSSSPESVALSKALKSNGLVFVGPVTMHAAMQACGLVDEHVLGCWVD